MTPLFEKFSSKENLKKAYEYVKFELKHSSLSVDPFNHHSITAIDDIYDEFFDALEISLRNNKYIPEKGFFMYMSKDNLGIRPVCVLSTTDRIVYQALFNQEILGNKIDAKLSNKVCFANRVNDNLDDLYFLKYYLKGWNSFSKTQKKSYKKGMVWRIELDIQQYFEHIPVKKIINTLQSSFGIKDNSITDVLYKQLQTWIEYPELEKGIPQGPNASSLIGNVYLSLLDNYVREKFDIENIHYSRYADDIVLMGKTKEDVLNTIQKIVVFIRELGLNLNEKTSLTLLEDTKIIDAMRFADYGDNDIDLPEDDFNLIAKEVPITISLMLNNEKVDKKKIRELKYFLGSSNEYDFNLTYNLIDVLSIYPSLIIPIIKYVSNSIMMYHFFYIKKDEKKKMFQKIWLLYSSGHLSEWSRFWILKFLIVTENNPLNMEVDNEVGQIILSKDRSILKIIGFYYKMINNLIIDNDELVDCIHEAKSNIEKSLFSFFLFSLLPEQINSSFIRSHIGDMLDNQSSELNLIGYFLLKNKFNTQLTGSVKPFSKYLLNKNLSKEDVQDSEYFMVNKIDLIPFNTNNTSEIMGISDVRKIKLPHLNIKENIDWSKVSIEFKNLFQDVDIYYDREHKGYFKSQEIGFNVSNSGLIDREWRFLVALSVLEGEDIEKATTSYFTRGLAIEEGKLVSSVSVNSAKYKLSKKLKRLFNTDKDPFYKYNNKHYQSIFIIKPDHEHKKIVLGRYNRINFNDNLDYKQNN